MMNMSVNYHVHMEPKAEIDLRHVTPVDGRKPYPRMLIGDVALFPSVEQVEAIRDACERYLDAHAPVAAGVAGKS